MQDEANVIFLQSDYDIGLDHVQANCGQQQSIIVD